MFKIFDSTKVSQPLPRVQLNGSIFMINDEVLNFHDWILCCHEPFHDNVKNLRKISTDLYLRNYNNVKCISREYANNYYLRRLSSLNYVDFVLLSSIDAFRVEITWKILISNFRQTIESSLIYSY